MQGRWMERPALDDESRIRRKGRNMNRKPEVKAGAVCVVLLVNR
jgi:hypothetical protein